MKQDNILTCISFCIILSIQFCISKPNPTKPKERNFSFAIPAFLLGSGIGGGTNNANYNNGVNNGNLPNYNTNSQYTNQNSNGGSGGIGSNLFQKMTITRTVLRTVATITAPVFRTCTTSAQALPSCAGRKKRSPEEEKDSETFNMQLILGSTTIYDQAIASAVLNLDKKTAGTTHGNKTMAEITALNEHAHFIPNLEPSEPIPTQANTKESSFNNDEPIIRRTPPVLIQGEEVEESRIEQARLGLGTTTVTRTYPVTAVVNSTVTGMVNNVAQVLTVSYLGCLPPSLPVSGSACP